MRAMVTPAVLLALLTATAHAQPPPPTGCSATIVDTPAPGDWKRIEVSFSSPALNFYRIYRNGVFHGRFFPATTGAVVFEDYAYPLPGDTEYCIEADDGNGGISTQCCLRLIAMTPERVEPEDWFHDAFPANENPGLPGTALFDTTTALIKTGRNIAQLTGTPLRADVPGDSLVVAAPSAHRVDLLFRIKLGVGNYQTVGNTSSGLAALTDVFCESYYTDPGPYSGVQPGVANPALAAASHAAAASNWSPLVWNSARMDTAESLALFPVQAQGVGAPPPGTVWCSTYHESDLSGSRATLAIVRNRCFLIDTLADPVDQNITCGDPAKGNYPPTWIADVLPASRTGWDGTIVTDEGTKIIPDGLLTPGAHVQYYLRIDNSPGPVVNLPDYTKVLQIAGEESVDGHRWQTFGILPDRWKDSAFGGLGSAAMLYVDLADGSGNERLWKGVADSIGATVVSAQGNADGYCCRPGNDTPQDNPIYYIDNKNAQPGTTWDRFNSVGSRAVNGNAGSLGSRLTPNVANRARIGPTPTMLDVYYTFMLIHTADRDEGILGPMNDRSQDDLAVIENWLLAGDTAVPNRGLIIEGESFIESEWQDPTHRNFVESHLGVRLVDPSYSYSFPDWRQSVPLKTSAPNVVGAFDIQNGGGADAIDVNLVAPGATVVGERETPVLSLVPASVYKAHSASSPFIAMTDAWDIARLGTNKTFADRTSARRMDPTDALATQGGASRNGYYYYTLNNLFAAVATITGSPALTVDVPQGGATSFIDFYRIFGNPMKEAATTLVFRTVQPAPLRVAIFDVTGRRVRMLAGRRFAAGEHRLEWDGRDEGGRAVPRGAYFARVIRQDGEEELSRKVLVVR